MATGTDEEATPLLVPQVDGFVDYKGRPILKSNPGGWRSAAFLIGVEVPERFSYYGIACNLITFLTGSLGESTTTAAENVDLWKGVSLLLPILGGFVADYFFGRYRTIIIASIIYILGLGLLSLLAVLTSRSSSSSNIYVILFYFALYLVAIGEGGHKPCVQAFGADQFDGKDPEESKSKSSFFNWWYFSSNVGVLVTFSVLVYIQDNLSWAFGFGIPCIMMVVALFIFLLGTRTYRYSTRTNKRHPFVRIDRVIVAAVRNWKITPLAMAPAEEACSSMPPHLSEQFKCLDKALLTTAGFMEDGKVCSAVEVEEAKAVLRLIRIWVSCLGYGVASVQSSTFFTKQGATMDRTITSNFRIPAASLQSFICVTIILIVPIYDRIFVRVSRAITMKPSGVTMLQRIGIGMVLSAISMVIAALVEMKRLQTAEENGLVNKPNATIPMSIWWLVPQYILFGAADVFTTIGLQEFFYDQAPVELRSIGLSLSLSIFGVGSILSSLLISAIDKVSDGTWFNDNLNQAHLDYFYWLLAGLSGVGLASFWYFAKSYIYKRESAG